MDKSQLREEKIKDMSKELEIVDMRDEDLEKDEMISFYRQQLRELRKYADELEDQHVLGSEWIKREKVINNMRKIIKLVK